MWIKARIIGESIGLIPATTSNSWNDKKNKATNQLSTSREGTSQDEILDHDSDLDDKRKKNNSLEGDSSLHIGTKRC